MIFDILKACLLGLVEGLTEFIPVSSTGHLLLMQHFFGFDDDDFGKTFAVLIQLGAILAILSIYFGKLSRIAGGAVLLYVDQFEFKPRYHDAMEFSLPMYLGIGLFQCLAMIPGVSR